MNPAFTGIEAPAQTDQLMQGAAVQSLFLDAGAAEVQSRDFSVPAEATPFAEPSAVSDSISSSSSVDPMARFIGGVFKTNPNPKARTRAASTGASPNREPHGWQRIGEVSTWKKMSGNGKKSARVQSDPYTWDAVSADVLQAGEQPAGQASDGQAAPS